ncbi:unnamed protein product [Paramecium sonneborni]|uniref:Uncharacterized protein n=1 Tax=Paramecium sonneborni TaxID=65129 RepID=A0A8S1RQW5_9CILI|nr:unnamed protein product [Paramecium sonneborni]
MKNRKNQLLKNQNFKNKKLYVPSQLIILLHIMLYQKLKIQQKNIKQLETSENQVKQKIKLEPPISTVREFKEAKYFEKASTEIERTEILKLLKNILNILIVIIKNSTTHFQSRRINKILFSIDQKDPDDIFIHSMYPPRRNNNFSIQKFRSANCSSSCLHNN